MVRVMELYIFHFGKECLAIFKVGFYCYAIDGEVPVVFQCARECRCVIMSAAPAKPAVTPGKRKRMATAGYTVNAVCL